MKIGYQGMKGSNSEAAANMFVQQQNLREATLVPLVTSAGVTAALINGEIDMGVMALQNTTAGEVAETALATQNQPLTIIAKSFMPISHHLFVSSNTIKLADIAAVVSHPQAISQCMSSIRRLLPNAQVLEIEDTAIGAYQLKSGQFDSNVAVLCSKNAGEISGLTLLHANMHDQANNATQFGLFKRVF